MVNDEFEIQTYRGQSTVLPILSNSLPKHVWREIASWQHCQSSVNSSKTWFKSCWLNLTSPSARFFSKSFVLALCSWMRASIFASDSLVNGRKVGRSSSVWNDCINQKSNLDQKAVYGIIWLFLLCTLYFDDVISYVVSKRFQV